MTGRKLRLTNILQRYVLIILGVIAVFATPAQSYAVDGYDSMGFRTTTQSLGPYLHFPGDHQSSDGNIAYCLNMQRPSPSEYGATEFTVYDQGWSWAEDVYNIIVWNGYPNTTTISGRTFDASSARAVTQLAIWMAAGTMSDAGIGNDGSDYTGNKGENEIVQAAAALKNAAMSGQLTAPKYSKRYYGVMRNGRQTQDMLWTPVSVTVTFTKTSAQASVTDGNDQYAYTGASYDIYRASDNSKVGSITTDEQGRASCSLNPGAEYYAVETKAPPGFELSDKRITFVAAAGTDVTLQDQPGSFELIINKRDSATGAGAQPGTSLEGAEFQITSPSGFSKTAKTDGNGRIVVTDIPLGTIRVVETKAPLGYKLDPTVRTYTVTAGDFASGNVTLEPNGDFLEDVIAFDIEITKFKDDGTEEGSALHDPAEGVVFEIISNTTDKVVGRITTDKDGKASTTGQWFGAGTRPGGVKGALPYDDAGYRVHEVEETVPKGYERIEDWTIDAKQVEDGTTLSYIAGNRIYAARLQIIKMDAETGLSVPLAGFTFQILDEAGKPISQEVWYPNHKVLDSFTTDESGIVTLPQRLAVGTYTIRESESQAPYLLTKDTSFTISDGTGSSSPLVTLRVEDEQARGRAHIIKRCSSDQELLEGAEFDVVAQEDITSPDGTVRAVKDQVVGHITTDAKGMATIEGLYLGRGTARYAFMETKAPNGHVLNPDPVPFEVSYQDGSTAVVTVSVEVENAPTTVEVHKTVLQSEEVLAGATFELWNAIDEIDRKDDDETAEKEGTSDDEQEDAVDEGGARDIELKEDAEVKTFISDEQGLIRIDHLAAGTYRLREVKAPAGFVTDHAVITFTVDENGYIGGENAYAIEAENDFTKVDISKRDITNEEELPGAELVLKDSEGNVIDEWVSGEEPHRIERLAPGEYTLIERMTPRNHDVAEEVTFTVEETGTVQSVAMHDEPISIEGELDKRQQIADPTAPGTEENGDGKNRAEVTVSENGSFEYYLDFRSTSNTWTDEFTVEDRLTAAVDGLATLDGIVTPVSTGDYDGKMNVWFRTDRTPVDELKPDDANATLDDGHENPWLNHESTREALGDDGRVVDYFGWRLWQQDVPTDKPSSLNVADLGLGENERIVGIRFEYGRVDPGFTTRSDGWDREDLKDEHDDVAEVEPEPEQNLAPVIVRMRVSDAYVEGTVLSNDARVDLYRNGGGDGLEDHDEDRVVQTPKTVPSPLPQTGAGFASGMVACLAVAAMLTKKLLRGNEQRHVPRNERSLPWRKL